MVYVKGSVIEAFHNEAKEEEDLHLLILFLSQTLQSTFMTSEHIMIFFKVVILYLFLSQSRLYDLKTKLTHVNSSTEMDSSVLRLQPL